MAIEVPGPVQGIFLVLTGERWPTANEDHLREVGNAWGTASERLENELGPYMLQVVQRIRENFTGKSAIKFADMMAPYVADPPKYIPQAAEQFQQLKKFLLDASTQVEYVKIISIEELILLIAQIAWAIAMAFWTDGASMTWLAGRMAIVRFLLKTWWGRLILQFVLAELFGIAFQLALDVLTQAIQFAKHTRTEWDVKATISAVEVGAVGGALSLPFSAASHFLSSKLTKGLTRVLSRDINVTTLQPVVVRAVNEAARNLGKNTPIREVAKNVTENLFRAADRPLRIRLVEIGVPAIIEMVEEGLHEAITEGVVMAANGQGFQFNPFSFTSGVASSIAGQAGHGIGTALKVPKPVREGYTRLGDGDGNGGRTGSPAVNAAGSSSDVGDTGSLTSFGDEESETAPLISPSARSDSAAMNPSSRGASSSADSARNGSSSANRGSDTTPPPTPPKDRTSASTTVSRGNGSTSSTSSPPVTPSRSTTEGNGRSGTSSTTPTSASRRPGTNERPAESGSSTPVPSSSRGRTGDAVSPSTPARSGGRTGESATASSNAGASGNRPTGTSSTNESTPPTRSSSATPKSGENEGAVRRDGTSSNNPFRDRGRSATTPPDTSGTPGRPATAGGQEGNGRAGENPSARSNGGPRDTSETRLPDRDRGETGQRQRETNPFRARHQAAEAADSHTRLPEELTKDAATVPAEELSSVLVPLGDRLVVTGRASANEAQAAAERLGVDVVARVDRAQVGNGRRKGVQWMSFPAGGGRPRPVETTPGPITAPAWSQPRLGDGAIKRGYPWLPKINPLYAKGGDFLTNCLLAAIGVDLTLEEARLDPAEDPDLLPFYQVSPDARSPYEYLANMGKGDPVDVPGYQAVVDAVRAAGPGARGMVLVGTRGTDVDHIFNVVHDGDGKIVFLDGQKGAQADLPASFRSLQFLPTSDGFPREAIAVNPAPWQHGRFIGAEPAEPSEADSAEKGADFVESLPWGQKSKDDPAGRYPFFGAGHELGEGGGTGGIPGVDKATRDKWAAEKAATLRKAEDGGKRKPAAEPAAPRPRRGGKGYGNDPATINDRPTAKAPPRPPAKPFSGTGRTLGEGDGTGGIPGVDKATRERWAADRAAALKAAGERKAAGDRTLAAEEERRPAVGEDEKPAGAPRPALTRRTGKGNTPATTDGLPPEAEPQPFQGRGHILGAGDGRGAGIPGVDNDVRGQSAADRAKKLGTPNPGETETKSKAGTKPKTKPETEPFSGAGQALGAGDGKGAGIPGLSDEVRERSAAERAQKAAARTAEPPTPPRPVPPRRTGKGFDGDPMTFADLPSEEPSAEKAGPFSGTGRTLGEGDGKGTGIPGLSIKDHRRAEAQRTRKSDDRTAARPAQRTGKGFGGDPMTTADPSTGRKPETRRRPFRGPGEVLGAGDGKGAGIPGLSNEVREAATAERAKLGGERGRPAKIRPVEASRRKAVTLDDLLDPAEESGRGTSANETHGLLQERGNGTVTMLETPTPPVRTPAETKTEAVTEERAEEKQAEKKQTTEESAEEKPVAESPVEEKQAEKKPVAEEPALEEPAVSEGKRTGKAAEENGTPAETGKRRDDTSSAATVEDATTAKSPAVQRVPAEPVPDPELSRARTTLGGLDQKQRAKAMSEAQAIVGALSGRVPAERDGGGQVSRVDRAGLLVAAEIARSGPQSGQRLARALAHDLDEPAPKPVPRVMIDKDRMEVAGTTLLLLKKTSEAQHTQVLNEARLIIKHLTGNSPSPFATRGQARRLALVWLVTAAEIAWAGHQSAEDLAADIMGLPRSADSGITSRYVTGFSNAARNDPKRARATLGLMSDGRAEQFLSQADSVIREVNAQGDAGALRAKRLLVAAEIARSGRQAGEDLVRELAGAMVQKRPRPADEQTKRVRFAEEVTVIDEETESDFETAHESEYASDQETEDDEETESTHESESTHETDSTHGSEYETAPEYESDDDEDEAAEGDQPHHDTVMAPPVFSASVRMPIEDVLGTTRVGMVGDRPVAIWLPGSPEEGPRFDADTIGRLGEIVPEGTVFVIGTGRDGRVMAGDQEISVAALAAAIAGRAPGMRPFLLVSGGARVAEPLSQALEELVLATPHEAVFDPVGGDVRSRRTGEPASDSESPDNWFRVFSPGDRAGRPILMGLLGKSRRDHRGGGRDGDPDPDPNPSSSSSSQPNHRRPHGAPPPAPRPPNPGPVAQPVATPITPEAAIRSIGVPRTGLPQQPELIRAIRQGLDAAHVRYSENEVSLLVHRLLANYPYLIGTNDEHGTDGFQVPVGNGELLITLDPTDPHLLNNPAGSSLVPSELPKVEGEHHAVDTINATYATGAHVQTQGGQTGATRGALALNFGIGVSPGVLQVVKVGGSISGTTNQSNRSTSHIADAEGGHVEDNRTEASLVSYTPNWSFKVRSDPNQGWADTPVTRLDGDSPEKLLLWIPGHYLDDPAPDQVIATGPAVRADRLPAFHFASGLTNIPQLFDEIVQTLRGQGLTLPMGSSIREELLQKLWNLSAHLDDAVNTDRGYRITLHNRYGRPVATVAVHSRRLAARRIGATSDKAHIENVRTAIDGTSGGHNVTNSSVVTPLSLEFDLVPNPAGLKDLGLGLSTSLSFTSTNVEGISTGRVGLNVLVPRNTSNTTADHVDFEHHAVVSVRRSRRRNEPRQTRPVRGEALVRMPEATAYEHGFPVDREALKNPPAHGGPQPYADGAIRDTGVRPGDPATKPVPQYVADGKGVGMGLVMVADATVTRIETELKARLRERGFLPADDEDPFGDVTWYSHGNKTDSLLDNLELLEKMVSSRGLDSHYDQIHQDGMTFTLRKRRGGLGADVDVDSAKVTIKARKNVWRPPRFRRSTNEYHTVNLAMGMDTAGMSVSHTRKLAWGIKFKALYQVLKASVTGIEFQRTVGASDSVSFLNNRPELLEYPGIVDEFELTSDYEIRIEYQHSGRQGKVKPGTRDPDPIHVTNQKALAYLLPLGNGTQNGPTSRHPTPHDVLDQAVIYYLDTTGARDAATRALQDIVGPAGLADQDVSTHTSTIEMRAHLKEALDGYTTDRLFDPGLLRDTFGAIDIAGKLGRSTFTGATGDKFVLGIIKLWLAENRLTDTSSLGWTWDQVDIAVGGAAGHANLTGEVDLNRHWQHNRSKGSGRTGGKELIQLDFNRVYAYQTDVYYSIRGHQEKHSKLIPSGAPKDHAEHMTPRTMVFLLPEPEALTRYADGTLPVSDEQLQDAMNRWRNGELKLSGDLAARILIRWQNEVQTLPLDARMLAQAMARMHVTGAARVLNRQVREDFNARFRQTLRDPEELYLHPRMPQRIVDYAEGRSDLTDERLAEALTDWRDGVLRLSGDVVARMLMRWQAEVPVLPPGVVVDRGGLVTTLAELHKVGGVPVASLDLRERFNATFHQKLGQPRVRYEHMELPEYLTRKDPNGRILGHTGIHDLNHNNKKSTYQIVKEQIDQVAPGMLAAGAEIWDGNGNVIGKMQGGVDALQSILGRGRDQAMWEDVLAKGGYSFYLVNPVGWLLSDVVEINLADVLTSAPEVHDFKPDTGLENYLHGYIGTGKTKSRDGSQGATFAKFSPSGVNAGGNADLKVAEGHHRGTTRAENAVTEQTVYDWSGHYRVRFERELTVRVRRLKMPGRPLNNLLMTGFKRWTGHGRTAEISVGGSLNLQVPRNLAEAGRLRGPAQVRDLVPLPKLPGNAYISGVILDDALPVARELLGRLFGPRWYEKALGARANDPNTRSSLSLPVLMSRSHLTNHVREATGGDRYKLADNLFIPGDSSERATMWLEGDFFDAEVIGEMKEGETGTGRYIKHQSGTTANNSTDLGRVVADYEVAGNDKINPFPPADPSQPAPPPHRPDHGWDLHNSGSRVTSASQNSAGTENYRREGHAKELGATLLIRMRGKFWIEAQKTRHHILWKSSAKGAPVRSDPFSGDVYVEMFEAQYRELRAQMAANEFQAQTALRDKVRRTEWQRLNTAPEFELAPLLADAARNNVDAFHVSHSLVAHIRDQAGGNRPLRLSVDEQDADRREYRAVLDWAVRTMRADLAAAREFDPTVETPRSLTRYLSYVRDGADTVPATLGQSVRDEISAMISEVNALHGLRPDNPRGAPATLPPEASLLSLDPQYLARDIAHELNAHVRLDIRRQDGSSYRRWVDPGGRIYAFDPVTSDVILTADAATYAGLWSAELRRDAVDHGLTPLEMGSFYRTSWARQQTFDQAVSAEIARRRELLAAVHDTLPGLFARTQQVRDDWTAEVARVEQEQADLAANATVAQDVRARRNADLGRRLNDANTQVREINDLLERMRAAEREAPHAARARWTDANVRTAEDRVTDLETLVEGRRIGRAYRLRQEDSVADAITALGRTLRAAGSGAVSIAVTREPHGEGGRFVVVNDDGRMRWFESPSGLEVAPPEDAEELYTLDLDPNGMLLGPPPELRNSPHVERSFPALRNAAIGLVGHQLRAGTPREDASAAFHRMPPALFRSVTAFELALASDDARRAAAAASPQAPRLVSLSTAQRGLLPDDPHLYEERHGQHGVGPAGLTVPGWRARGPLSDYTPVFWLTQGGPGHVPTVADVARTGLGGAVRFLAGDARTMAQRVGRAFTRDDRDLVVDDELPAGLPAGTWVWFSGPAATGAAVVTPHGYRVLVVGEANISVVSEQEVRAALNEDGGQTFVIGRPRTSRRGGQDRGPSSASALGLGRSGGTRQGGPQGQRHGGRQGERQGGSSRPSGGRRTVVDTPAPADPHLYVDRDGNHRVSGPGLNRDGVTDLGAISTYAPVSWLLSGGPARAVTGPQVVASDLDLAERFLTEVSVLGDPAETVRSLLAGTTGRSVELTTTLPAALPPGTMVYFTGPTHTGAAVALAGGGYRRTIGGAPLLSPDQTGMRSMNDGRHTFVIARPKTQPNTRTDESDAVEEAARRAMSLESQRHDPARLAAALRRRGLEAIEVPLDDNCFYHSLIAIAGPYLARQISGLKPEGDAREAVRVLRNWLANRLQADLAVAARGLPSRYADFFHVAGNTPIAVQQAALVDQIRRMDTWHNEAGDLVAHLAAYELGLPLTLIQDRYVTTLGPDGPARINFIRTPGHFRGARPVNDDAPQVAWETLRPVRPTSVPAAEHLFRARIEAMERRLGDAIREFQDLGQRFPGNVGPGRRNRFDGFITGFRQGRAPDAHQNLPAHVRAQQRIDDMFRAVRDVEGLNAEIRGEVGRPNVPVPAHAAARQQASTSRRRTQVPVTDYLVSEVNTRLRSFGPGWTGGAVDREDVEQALSEVPQGGPSDLRGLANDLANHLALGAVVKDKGGAMGLELETGFELGGLDPNDPLNATLITTPEYSLVIDHAKARSGPNAGRTVPIIEIVLNPVNSLNGETGWLRREDAFRTLSSILDRLRHARRGATIARIFRNVPGAVPHPYAYRATLQGDTDAGRMYTQFSVGVPMSGIREFLRAVAQGNAYDEDWSAIRHGQSALAFGDTVAARFAHVDDGRGLSDRLDRLAANDADLALVRNYATLVYTQVASQLGWIVEEDTLAKNNTLIASRVALAAMRESLPRRVRRFMENDAAWIGARFQDRFRRDNRRELRRANLADSADLLGVNWSYWDQAANANGPQHTIGQYLGNALVPITDPARRISQWESLGIGTELPRMDDNFGHRRADPLVVLEVRFFGTLKHRDLDAVGADYDRLERSARAADQESGVLRALKSGTGVEVRFAEQERHERESGQSKTLDDFAAFVGLAAQRRHAAGAGDLIVNIEGGGNGGIFSNPREAGWDRAEAVEDELKSVVRRELRRRRLPEGMVRFVLFSRGNRTRSRYPFTRTEGAADERQRRVLVWVGPSTEQVRVVAPIVHAEPGTSAMVTNAAPLSPPWTNALTQHVNSALAAMTRPNVRAVDQRRVLDAYGSLPGWLKNDAIPVLAPRIAELILTGRVTVRPGGTQNPMLAGDTDPAEPGPGGIRPMRAPGSATGKGKGNAGWHTFVRAAADRTGTQRYEVRDDGWIRLPDGEMLAPDQWARHGGDFVHLPTAMYLRGADGRIEKVDGWETLRETLGEGTLVPHTMAADASNIYLTPDEGGPTVGLPLVVAQSGSLAQSIYQVLSGTPAPASTPAPTPAPASAPAKYSAEDSFDIEYAATVEEFPVVIQNERWTVWGQGAEEADARVFVAESQALGGLRGQYDAGPPKAGRVADPEGRLYSEGPAWNWYLPGGSAAVASSRPKTDLRSELSEDPGAPVSVPSPHPVTDRPPVDPSLTAARPRTLGSGLPHAMKWRSDEGGAPLHKFSEKAPEEVFRDGLRPKGERLGHVLEHVYKSPQDTGYVSTTRNRDYVHQSAMNNPGAAAALHGRYRYRYDVVLPGGIDVNATLDIASPFPDQEEVVFPGGIDVRFIRGVQALENGSPTGEYIVNPDFDPDLGS